MNKINVKETLIITWSEKDEITQTKMHTETPLSAQFQLQNQ